MSTTSEFFEVACKTSRKEVDFKRLFATYIADELKLDPADFSSAVGTFQDLRDTVAARSRPLDVSEGGITSVKKYIGQLKSARNRFPIHAGEKWNGVLPIPLQFDFTWSDTFPATGVFAKTENSSSNVNFELASALFNLGALHSRVACTSTLRDDDAIKTAFLNFQGSACTFNALSELVRARFSTAPSPDMDASTLDALAKLMTAQAQETMWVKSTSGKPMGDSIIAKLAMQASSDYAVAARAVSQNATMAKKWGKTLAAKEVFFKGEAHFRQAQVEAAASQFGKQVAHLKMAADFVGQAAKDLAMAKTKANNYKSAAQKAENDNREIYMKPIPQDVDAIPPKAMVKANAPLADFESEEVRGSELFKDIIPVSTSRTKVEYERQRDEQVDDLVKRLRDATMTTVTRLAEWNLPAAIEVNENPQELPPSFVDKIADVRSLGGIDKLNDLIAALPGLRSNVTEIIEESTRMLDVEQEEDEALKAKHGSKWTRTPSAEINSATRSEGQKLLTVLGNAADSDQQIHGKYDENQAAFVTLSKTPGEVGALLPQAAAQRTSSGSVAGIGELKAQMSALDQLRGQREELESAITSEKESDDIVQSLLQTDVDEASVIKDQLQRYQPLKEQVDSVVTRTTEALNATDVANQTFVNSRAGNANTERENTISDLQAKAEIFKELIGNLEEGAKFYNQLATLAEKYRTKVTDFCSVRRDEKAGLLSDLTKEIATVPAESYDGAAVAVAGAAMAGNNPYGTAPAVSPPLSAVNQGPPSFESAPQMPMSGGPPPQQQQQPYGYNPQNAYAQPPTGHMPPPHQQPMQHAPYGQAPQHPMQGMPPMQTPPYGQPHPQHPPQPGYGMPPQQYQTQPPPQQQGYAPNPYQSNPYQQNPYGAPPPSGASSPALAQLQDMFPQLPRSTLEVVLEREQGDVRRAINVLLSMS